ncbi:MAG: DUF3443 domain-containing protein [Terriglobales bacterium]
MGRLLRHGHLFWERGVPLAGNGRPLPLRASPSGRVRPHYGWVLLLILPLAACGGSGSSGGGGGGGNGGGSTPSGPNVVPVVSNLGVTQDYTNGLFTSVTVCVPGTSNCTTVDNVLVDTGSYGLRLLSSQLGNLPLPMSTAPDGSPLGECTAYATTYNWGPVATADVKLGGETAPDIPVQLLGVSGFPGAPSACTSGGLTENDTQADLGANGILGIGVFRYDCGQACSSDQGGNPNSVPPVYFSCPASGCSATLIPLADEAQNPVTLFATDNNGELIQLPGVPDSGATTVNGYLIFGIGTQGNNGLLGQAVLGADGYGDFDTVFQGSTYQGSVLDSGSNANFFLDAQTLNIGLCSGNNSGFYCPGSEIRYSGTNLSADGSVSASATWNVANAQNLFNTGNAAFNNLAGPDPNNFDFGLAFFFGRTVGIGFNGAQVQVLGTTYVGPFYAY